MATVNSVHRAAASFGLFAILMVGFMPDEENLVVSRVQGKEPPLILENGTINPLAFNLPITAQEMMEKRTERAAVFSLGRKKYAAVSGRFPLEMDVKRDGEIVMFESNTQTIRFDLSHPHYVIEREGETLEIAFIAQGRGFLENKNTVTYVLADHVVLRWIVEGSSVRKEIWILEDRPLPDLSFAMTASEGLTREKKEGRFAWKNGSGRTLFVMEEPFLADGKMKPLARPVAMEEQKDGSFVYAYEKMGLEYPYAIDPQVGPNDPGTIVNDTNIGDNAWNTPSNAALLDDVYADASASAFDAGSNYLKATNFGFSIPDGAVIDGIVVEVSRGDAGATPVKDNAARIVKNGTIGSTDKSNVNDWIGAMSYVFYGSSSEKWGESWTTADINSSGFGFALAIQNNNEAGGSGVVDHIRITVSYSTAASDVPVFTWWTLPLLIPGLSLAAKRRQTS